MGSVRVARDITEQKNAQIERDNTKEQLRKAEKMEAIGFLAGGVAHDLNNILSGVVSYPEMLLHQLPKQDEFYEHIKFIHDSGKRAAAVVADLLTVARGVATVREVRSLNALIIDYLGSIELKNIQSLYPQVDLISNLEADLWNIRCSPVHIQKMLMNLITNGIEAIDGKGSVHVSTVNKIIQPDNRVPSIPAGEYVVLTVHDTGTGIAKHDLEKIFEPFYTKKVMGRSGTGLGLAVVWNIVTDHGANIDVNSDSRGTTFIIHFPASSKEKVVSEKNIDITSLNGTGSILIVDDEQDQQRIASQMLGSLGYSTTSVSSGEEAVKFFQGNSADLVILDMVMEPGMNGRKTYKEIIKIVPDQKAIIASGFSESDDVKAALKLGAGSY
ncbi:MAG TPA: response regulator, partial [Desulfobacterales bacterium]|nr:response regulator [Desulfobacterales bacterium]